VGGLEPADTVEAIIEQFGDTAKEIDLVIDDEDRIIGKPSTVVRCVDDVPEIVREGALSREQLGM
jgi:tRNA A37 threonylcarbamoyladenosine synthetase subunit TsaC/SUA5/YrdC